MLCDYVPVTGLIFHGYIVCGNCEGCINPFKICMTMGIYLDWVGYV